MNGFVEDLEEVLEEVGRETADYDDDDAADFALPYVLIAFGRSLHPQRLAARLREAAETLERGGEALLVDRSKGVPPPPLPPPPLRSVEPAQVTIARDLPPFCWKCGGGHAAVCLRFDAVSGQFRAVCEAHARTATPFEKRPLP